MVALSSSVASRSSSNATSPQERFIGTPLTGSIAFENCHDHLARCVCPSENRTINRSGMTVLVTTTRLVKMVLSIMISRVVFVITTVRIVSLGSASRTLRTSSSISCLGTISNEVMLTASSIRPIWPATLRFSTPSGSS